MQIRQALLSIDVLLEFILSSLVVTLSLGGLRSNRLLRNPALKLDTRQSPMQLPSLFGLSLFSTNFNSSDLLLWFYGAKMLELLICSKPRFPCTSKLIIISFTSKSIYRSFVLATCQQKIRLPIFSQNHNQRVVSFN